MADAADIAIPIIVGVILGALLVYAGVFVFTAILIVGVFLLLVSLYDRYGAAVVPGISGWWIVVGVAAILLSGLGYSKGFLTLAP